MLLLIIKYLKLFESILTNISNIVDRVGSDLNQSLLLLRRVGTSDTRGSCLRIKRKRRKFSQTCQKSREKKMSLKQVENKCSLNDIVNDIPESLSPDGFKFLSSFLLVPDDPL